MNVPRINVGMLEFEFEARRCSDINIQKKIARIRSQDYLNPKFSRVYNKENLPIDVIISPELEISKSIQRKLEAPGALDSVPFADNKIRLLEILIKDGCKSIDIKFNEKHFERVLHHEIFHMINDSHKKKFTDEKWKNFSNLNFFFFWRHIWCINSFHAYNMITTINVMSLPSYSS